MTRQELQAWAESEGVEVSEEGWERIERLVALWQRYGRAINIVGSTERGALLEHVQEGLQCVGCVEKVRAVDEGCRWVDVGSGGGLPGLVVAAVRGCEVILVEPRERRAGFLDLGLAAVGMGTGRVIRGRWGISTWNEIVDSGVGLRDKTSFWILSSRAVFSPARWIEEAETIADIPRGIIVCHVEIGVETISGRVPMATMSGSRWRVLGFSTGAVEGRGEVEAESPTE